MNFTFFERFFWNIYIIDIKKTTFEHEEEVPDFTEGIVPIFLTLIVIENLVEFIHKGKINKINDGVTSVSCGFIFDAFKLLTEGFEIIGYRWLYQHRFFDFDWSSPTTWWIAAIGVDLGFYWAHRMSHEVSIIWCGHQAHHSSEEYNLTTALRQSAFQRLFYLGFYHPLALLGVPLPAVLVHLQFNLFGQFLLHTQLIPNLGPLEWFFNTPSHHKVHHGINKWCLDKNYGAMLIIWDRIFGTFQQIRYDEPIIYGLVDQPQTMQPFYLQVFYFKLVIEKARAQKTYKDSLKAIFWSPGWNPGSPRLGDEDQIPDKTSARDKYERKLSVPMEIYIVIHFLMVVFAQQLMAVHYSTLSWKSALEFIFLIYLSFFTIGLFFDGVWWASLIEATRCAVLSYMLYGTSMSMTGYEIVDQAVLGYLILSTLIWTFQSITCLLSGEKVKTQ